MDCFWLWIVALFYDRLHLTDFLKIVFINLFKGGQIISTNPENLQFTFKFLIVINSWYAQGLHDFKHFNQNNSFCLGQNSLLTSIKPHSAEWNPFLRNSYSWVQHSRVRVCGWMFNRRARRQYMPRCSFCARRAHILSGEREEFPARIFLTESGG